MSDICFEVNPRVAALLAEAVKAARPFWVGWCRNGKEVLWRLPTLLEPDGAGQMYFNPVPLLWGPLKIYQTMDVCFIAETPTGPWFNKCGRVYRLAPGDSIMFFRGKLQIWGKLP